MFGLPELARTAMRPATAGVRRDGEGSPGKQGSDDSFGVWASSSLVVRVWWFQFGSLSFKFVFEFLVF
jgi:hypothetical protein